MRGARNTCHVLPLLLFWTTVLAHGKEADAVLDLAEHPGLSVLRENGEECGLTLDLHFVAGLGSLPGQQPWMAVLQYQSQGDGPADTDRPPCGGTLIGDRYILTSTFCVARPEVKDTPTLDTQLYQVRVNDRNLTEEGECVRAFRDDQCFEEQVLGVDEVIIHPGFNLSSPFQDNLALVRLDRPVTRSTYVQPICLPLDFSQVNLTAAQWLEAVNFGSPLSEHYNQIMIEANVQLTDCHDFLQRLRKPAGFEDGHLCVDSWPGYGDTADCLLPAGTPLVNTRPSQGAQLVGVGSVTTCSYGGGVPDMYTQLTEDNVRWVLDTVEEDALVTAGEQTKTRT